MLSHMNGEIFAGDCVAGKKEEEGIDRDLSEKCNRRDGGPVPSRPPPPSPLTTLLPPPGPLNTLKYPNTPKTKRPPAAEGRVLDLQPTRGVGAAGARGAGRGQ